MFPVTLWSSLHDIMEPEHLRSQSYAPGREFLSGSLKGNVSIVHYLILRACYERALQYWEQTNDLTHHAETGDSQLFTGHSHPSIPGVEILDTRHIVICNS